MCIRDSLRLRYLPLSAVIYDEPWLSTVIYSYLRLSVIIYSYLQLYKIDGQRFERASVAKLMDFILKSHQQLLNDMRTRQNHKFLQESEAKLRNLLRHIQQDDIAKCEFELDELRWH